MTKICYQSQTNKHILTQIETYMTTENILTLGMHAFACKVFCRRRRRRQCCI